MAPQKKLTPQRSTRTKILSDRTTSLTKEALDVECTRLGLGIEDLFDLIGTALSAAQGNDKRGQLNHHDVQVLAAFMRQILKGSLLAADWAAPTWLPEVHEEAIRAASQRLELLNVQGERLAT